MKAPQVIMIVLMSLSWMLNACNHGERGPDYDVLVASFSIAFSVFLLKWGGFF